MVTFLAMVASPENISPMVKHNPSANSVLEISINSVHSPYTIYNLFQKYLNTIIYLIIIERGGIIYSIKLKNIIKGKLPSNNLKIFYIYISAWDSRAFIFCKIIRKEKKPVPIFVSWRQQEKNSSVS